MPVEETPEKNAIMFVWFNRYAGILVKTPTKTLVIDPVDVKPRSLQNTDAILVTHEHYDHLDQRLVVEIQKSTNCRVIADSTSARSLKNTLPPNKLEEIRPGVETKIGEVIIKAEKSQHPAAQPVTLIITSEDGVKIFHTSDSLPFPEMVTIGEREKLDIAFCTVSIAPGATPETGFEIARLTKPQVAVPYHTNSQNDQRRFAEILKAQMPRTACLIPEQNKIYQVTKRR
ncbi:MAG TPA: MBL fold metallo-hydrolase [Candidatus Bathyarchaeia archaeon]